MKKYKWNPLWHPVEDPTAAQEYLSQIQDMIMASVNWIANNPEAIPMWSEIDRADIAAEAGLPRETQVAIIGDWDMVFTPSNAACRRWFDAIVTASTDTPTIHMMQKAIYCGWAFKHYGWERFDQFMQEH